MSSERGAGYATYVLLLLLTVLSLSYADRYLFSILIPAIKAEFGPQDRTQAGGVLVLVISVVGSLLGPVVAGLTSEWLTPRFGDESLRYRLLSLSLIILGASWLFWQAARYYRDDLAAV